MRLGLLRVDKSGGYRIRWVSNQGDIESGRIRGISNQGESRGYRIRGTLFQGNIESGGISNPGGHRGEIGSAARTTLNSYPALETNQGHIKLTGLRVRSGRPRSPQHLCCLCHQCGPTRKDGREIATVAP